MSSSSCALCCTYNKAKGYSLDLGLLLGHRFEESIKLSHDIVKNCLAISHEKIARLNQPLTINPNIKNMQTYKNKKFYSTQQLCTRLGHSTLSVPRWLMPSYRFWWKKITWTPIPPTKRKPKYFWLKKKIFFLLAQTLKFGLFHWTVTLSCLLNLMYFLFHGEVSI